ncbi:MAG: hypothetical protein AAFV07_03520, partial [Bacteroidota bacterium]
KTQLVEAEMNWPFIDLSYFYPVGVPGCGYGVYWETKALICFPIIEYETHRDNCTHDDWGQYIRDGYWDL